MNQESKIISGAFGEVLMDAHLKLIRGIEVSPGLEVTKEGGGNWVDTVSARSSSQLLQGRIR
jgi:translation initiation factor 2 gamma subunit (eIF-2gamma)